LPIIIDLVILKHFKNISVLMKNESNQQLDEKISLTVNDEKLPRANKCSLNVIIYQTLKFSRASRHPVKYKEGFAGEITLPDLTNASETRRFRPP